LSGGAVMPAPPRFRAPQADGAVLAEPGFEALPGLVEENRKRLNRVNVHIGGVPLFRFRMRAREEILFENAAELPLIIAGHQPELSHPGVWVKNFALHRLARRVDGIPLNLVADTDTLKSASLRFPTWDSDPRHAHLQSVAFDRMEAEQPYETRRVLDPDLFVSFADRVQPLTRAWGYEPILSRVWPQIVAHPARTIGEKFARVRRVLEMDWGCNNIELPVSGIAGSEAFARFATHILEDLPRFREVYNRAVQAFREQHGIRSRNHPVPDLAEGEAPFWGPTGPNGRRGRVMANSAVEPRHLRPRALTLTLFARVCLGDFFIHGIGGGIYDEVTDAIIRDYFGLEPPAYQVLSATLHLPLPKLSCTDADVKRLEHRVRDLHWNPQRHLEDLPNEFAAIAKLRDEKQSLAENEPERQAHSARREWFRKLQDVTSNLRWVVQQQTSQAQKDLELVRKEAAANAVLRRRDYSWVLYPEDTLREFCQRFLQV
jgi:hypothetical protein